MSQELMVFLALGVIIFVALFIITKFSETPDKSDTVGSLFSPQKYSNTLQQRSSKTWDIELSIPEIGSPGTASDAQTKAVERMFGQPLPQPISYEQASLILDCREYARAMADVFDREGKPVNEEISTPLIVAFILSDKPLRDYVSKWSHNRFARGTHNEPPRLRRNEHFFKVYQFLSGQIK